MIKDSNKLKRAVKFYPEVSDVISTIHSEEQYNRMIELLDDLIDEINKKNDHVKKSLIDTIGTLIKDYEDRVLKEKESDPIGVLKYLMEEHNLKQSDLPEIGSQGVVSEILNGKRKLNLRQIEALSKRFSVSPAVFID
jgi:HTH-type transcriptional regulator/antitoxin HigA